MCKNGNLIDIMQKKANLKMETVHEFVQKLQPYWHCATKSKKAQSENGNFGVDKKMILSSQSFCGSAGVKEGTARR